MPAAFDFVRYPSGYFLTRNSNNVLRILISGKAWKVRIANVTSFNIFSSVTRTPVFLRDINNPRCNDIRVEDTQDSGC